MMREFPTLQIAVATTAERPKVAPFDRLRAPRAESRGEIQVAGVGPRDT